jgi:hypothetical protein
VKLAIADAGELCRVEIVLATVRAVRERERELLARLFDFSELPIGLGEPEAEFPARIAFMPRSK